MAWDYTLATASYCRDMRGQWSQPAPDAAPALSSPPPVAARGKAARTGSGGCPRAGVAVTVRAHGPGGGECGGLDTSNRSNEKRGKFICAKGGESERGGGSHERKPPHPLFFFTLAMP